MEEKCPISAHVTFRNILMSRRMTARECFIHDFAVCQRFMNTPDFFEGIRCNLMEKGQKPKWSHKSIY
jgi:enoyl-CoA hydratase